MCAFSLSEVLNVQPTTSTVLTFGPDDRPAAAGRDPWWSSDDSLRPGRTVPCIACGSPDPDCAAHSELHRSHLPDPRRADRDFWPMNPHLGTDNKIHWCCLCLVAELRVVFICFHRGDSQ